MITLKAARVNAGLTQMEVAKTIGVAPATFSHWETGRTDLTASMFKQLCDLYGVNISEVVLPKSKLKED